MAAPILYGTKDATGTADTSGMPRLAVIDAAAVLAKTLNVHVDASQMEAHLESLRVGKMYKSDVKPNVSGELSSTALAIQISSMFKQPSPRSVSENITAQIPHALSLHDPAQLFSYTIPVLTSMSDGELRAHNQQVRGEISWIAGRLTMMSPLERLSAASSLGHAIAVSGSPVWSTVTVCSGLHESAGGLQMGSPTATDPQATAEAISVGCTLNVSIPPWTTSGWPNDELTSSAAQASVAGLRLSSNLGVAGDYRMLLTHQLTDVWLNPQVTDPTNTDALSVEMLGKLLGVTIPTATGFEGLLTSAISANPGVQSLSIYLAAMLQNVHVSARTPSSPTAKLDVAHSNIFTAAANEAEFRITGVRALHENALSIVRNLSLGSGLYAAEPASGGRSAPSISATAIVDWITGKPIPTDVLQRDRLCNSELSCGTPGPNSPIDSPLRATAAVVVLAHPDAALFPFAL